METLRRLVAASMSLPLIAFSASLEVSRCFAGERAAGQSGPGGIGSTAVPSKIPQVQGIAFPLPATPGQAASAGTGSLGIGEGANRGLAVDAAGRVELAQRPAKDPRRGILPSLSRQIRGILSLPKIGDRLAGFGAFFDAGRTLPPGTPLGEDAGAPGLSNRDAEGADQPRLRLSAIEESSSVDAAGGRAPPAPPGPARGEAPNPTEPAPPALGRALGRASATLLTAAMIIGTGIFGALGAATAAAGTGLLVSMLLGGLVALATGMSAAQLGVNIPKEGGAFTWAREFKYPTLGFVAGASYLGKGIMSASVISLAFATYSAQLVASVPTSLMAAALLVTAIGINSIGLKITTKVLIGLVLANAALLGVFVVLAAPAVSAAHLTPVLGHGLKGILSGAAIFFWTWDGFMRTAIMAGEVKEPRKTIPFAIIGGIVIAAAVFFAVGAATLGVLGPQAAGLDDAPLFRAARTLGATASWSVLAAAWTATISEIIGDLLSASRVALSMGQAGELPKWLGRIHAGSKAPRNAILAIGAAVVGLVLAFDLRPLLQIASVFTLAWYGITHYLALRLPKSQRILPILFTWLGLAGVAALLFSLQPWATGIAALVLAGLAGARRLLGKREPAHTP